MGRDNRRCKRATGFEWDETNREFNLGKHAIDFRRAIMVFDGRPTFTRPSSHASAERFLTTAFLDDVFVSAVLDVAGNEDHIHLSHGSNPWGWLPVADE